MSRDHTNDASCTDNLGIPRGFFRTATATAALALLAAALRIFGFDQSFAYEAKPGRENLALGAKAPGLEFTDIRFLPHTLDEWPDASAYVIVFLNTDCPVAQRVIPVLSALHAEMEPRGVRFLGIYTGPDQSIPAMAAHALEFAVPFPVGRDREDRCVLGLGATRTPEVVVLDAERVLRYRGRIDDRFRLGGQRNQPAREDLREALEDVLNRRPVKVPETPVDGCKITVAETLKNADNVTFARDIAPLMQNHCQTCHRPGGGAPFSLLTYSDARQHAEVITETVQEERMPPWYGVQRHEHFSNARGLSPDERELIATWVRLGGPLGNRTETPPNPKFPAVDQWTIHPPDLVLTQPLVHQVPATGLLAYRYVIFAHVFLEDTWVQEIEILPDNPAAVHHANLAFAQLGQSFRTENFLTGRVPGGEPMNLADGLAVCIPKGSILALQVHLVTTGKPTTSRISVGLRYPRVTVQKQLHHVQVTTSRFAIPPYASAFPVRSQRVIPFDAFGVGMFSHMHLRGKDMEFTAVRPDGSRETLLTVPNYSFDWQHAYRWPHLTKRIPAKTAIEVVAHYDNSPFNPYNPAPGITVRHGDQTEAEMMFGFLFYVSAQEQLQLTVDPRTGHVIPKKTAGRNPATSSP